MTPSARIAAAIEILDDQQKRIRPLSEALKDWGTSHRFAGSGDRAAIGNLLYDAYRVKSSAAWLMDDESPRGIILGAMVRQSHLRLPDFELLLTGEGYGSEKLTAAEIARLQPEAIKAAEAELRNPNSALPAPLRGDYPEWLHPLLSASLGEMLVPEMQAQTTRAALDLRINRLKADHQSIAPLLEHLAPEPMDYARDGLRIRPNAQGRLPSMQGEEAFIRGFVEVQDEGSQLVSLLCGARPDEVVLDYCAGGGGKSLALAADMQNEGYLFASDSDARRLAPLEERMRRAGADMIELRLPRGGKPQLADLRGEMDLVLIDAPCTGAGTFRRNPDTKWRMRPGSLAARVKDQAQVLLDACQYVRKGGQLAYVTCSLLHEENGAQIAQFLHDNPDFRPIPPEKICEAARLPQLATHQDVSNHGLLLSPLRSGTDGFFIAMLERV